MARGLGRIWAGQGHRVLLSSRDVKVAAEVAAGVGHGAQAGTVKEAASFGDVVLLAIPWTATAEVLKTAGPMDGKILIDCTNPLTQDMTSLAVGHLTSGAEEIAKMCPATKVVKAFNTAFAEVYETPSRLFGSRMPTMFFCGDSDGAKTIIKGLIVESGFEPVDAGPLRSARFLEPLAMLMIQLGYWQGMGRNISISLVQR